MSELKAVYLIERRTKGKGPWLVASEIPWISKSAVEKCVAAENRDEGSYEFRVATFVREENNRDK